jgi:hypothetical protein
MPWKKDGSGAGAKRGPARHRTRRPRDLAPLERPPSPQPRRGEARMNCMNPLGRKLAAVRHRPRTVARWARTGGAAAGDRLDAAPSIARPPSSSSASPSSTASPPPASPSRSPSADVRRGRGSPAFRCFVQQRRREVIRDDQFVLFIRPGTVRHCVRLWARCSFFIRDFWQGSGSLRTLPPDLRIGRHGAVLLTALRLRVNLRHRIISRTRRTRERSKTFEMQGCFTPSRRRRGALEERHRPFGDPFGVKL